MIDLYTHSIDCAVQLITLDMVWLGFVWPINQTVRVMHSRAQMRIVNWVLVFVFRIRSFRPIHRFEAVLVKTSYCRLYDAALTVQLIEDRCK